MCDSGRFVMCGYCHLSVNFPAGADYATIAKQIEPKLCSGRIAVEVDTCQKIGSDGQSPHGSYTLDAV